MAIVDPHASSEHPPTADSALLWFSCLDCRATRRLWITPRGVDPTGYPVLFRRTEPITGPIVTSGTRIDGGAAAPGYELCFACQLTVEDAIAGLPGFAPPIAITGRLAPDADQPHRCDFCGQHYPPIGLLPGIPICLHCAGFDWRTRGDALQLKQDRRVRWIEPMAWDIVQQTTAGQRACLKCKRVVNRAQPNTTLGVDRWCIGCVIDRARDSGTRSPAPSRTKKSSRTPKAGISHTSNSKYGNAKAELIAEARRLMAAEQCSIRTAAKKLRIPESTLQGWLKPDDQTRRRRSA